MQRNRMRVKRAYVLAAGVSILCAGLLAQAAEASTAKSPPGTITTIAGGPGGPGPALGVGLSVCSVRFVRGALYISGDAMVRRVNPRTGWLTTPSANWLAVNWVTFDVADGNLEPCGVTVDSSGNVLEATGSQVVVVAGKSGRFYGHRMRAGHTYVIVDEHRRPRLPGGRSGNGGPALGARLADSVDVQLDSAGNVILTDAGQGAGRDTPALGALVRVVAEHTGRFYGQKMRTGNIYTIAGAAALPAKPSSIATRTWLGSSIRTARVDRYGNLVVVNGFGLANTHGDTTPAVRVVAVRTGSFYGRRMVAGHMYLVAGNGTGRDSGDGGPASRAGLACAVFGW
jgi:hypothetical protein